MTDVSTLSRPIGAATRDVEPHILVIAGSSSRPFDLPVSGRVLVGRAPEADLRLEDDSISRRHAMFTTRAGAIAVADLDSHNGTQVNGEPLAGLRELAFGDVVQLGDVVIVAYGGGSTIPTLDVVTSTMLVTKLEAELERAAAFGRELAVIAIRHDAPRAAAEIAVVISDELRAIDVIGELGTRTVLIAPELDASAAVELAARCSARLGAGARVGLAICPDHGADAQALLGAARAAADVATAGGVADADAAIVRLELGDRPTLIVDPAMLRLIELARQIARTELAVLVRGETGAGKEHIARALHAFGPRAAGPFVALNCAAVQDALVESELFGYDKGAFTGAAGAKPGLLEAAAGGTVFLDEVGELSAAMQAKLLRALDAKRITRVGSVVERSIDIRVIAATHRDLEADVATGRFRRDLYFRLAGATIALPPLRDRKREIACLARAFLDDASRHLGRTPLRPSAGAMRALASYAWPGNVRELRNAIEYAAATAGDSETIEAWHLPPRVGSFEDPGEVAPAAAMTFRPLAEELQDLERRRMREAIATADGVLKAAARLLGMPLRTFHLKAKHYGLSSKRGTGSPNDVTG